MKKQVLLTGLFAGISLLSFVLAMAVLGIPESSRTERTEARPVQNAVVKVYFSNSPGMPPALYSVKTGKTVREVLSEHYNIETSFSLIKCIDNVCNEGSYLWHAALNGKAMPQSVLNYALKPGDVVEIRYGRLS